jgi:hypothetical protein
MSKVTKKEKQIVKVTVISKNSSLKGIVSIKVNDKILDVPKM